MATNDYWRELVPRCGTCKSWNAANCIGDGRFMCDNLGVYRRELDFCSDHEPIEEPNPETKRST